MASGYDIDYSPHDPVTKAYLEKVIKFEANCTNNRKGIERPKSANNVVLDEFDVDISRNEKYRVIIKRMYFLCNMKSFQVKNELIDHVCKDFKGRDEAIKKYFRYDVLKLMPGQLVTRVCDFGCNCDIYGLRYREQSVARQTWDNFVKEINRRRIYIEKYKIDAHLHRNTIHYEFSDDCLKAIEVCSNAIADEDRYEAIVKAN